MEKLHVLGVVEEAQRGLDFAAPHSEPVFQAVVRHRPIQLRLIPAQFTDVIQIQLCSHVESITDLHRDVETKVRHVEGAPTGLHGQIVVLVRVCKTLRGKAVCLNWPPRQLEIELCEQRPRRRTDKGQKRDPPHPHHHRPRVYSDVHRYPPLPIRFSRPIEPCSDPPPTWGGSTLPKDGGKLPPPY